MEKPVPWDEQMQRRASEKPAGPTGEAAARQWRVALYSHDTMGLGHVRRNLLIAQALARAPVRAVTLLVAGAREASALAMPSGMDCLTLPALRKQGEGQYQARRLAISLQELIALRANAIRAALEAFAPDVLIVDNVPRGAVRELELTLRYLRTGGRTRIVLGLRDVLDDPVAVHREWRRMANEAAIRDYYDVVCVYGDRAVYDPVAEYGFSPEVEAKVVYTGYLDQRMRLKFMDGETATLAADVLSPSERFVLCLVGGGEDGARLAEAFAYAEFPSGCRGVILMGPFMPSALRQRLRHLAVARPHLQVLESLPEPVLLSSRADRIIAMGGYNTIGEVLSFEKHALIVPRVKPRREQLIRAERMRDLGLLDVLHPDRLDPRALSAWLAREVGPSPRVRDRVDLNGLARLPGLLNGARPSPVPRARPVL